MRIPLAVPLATTSSSVYPGTPRHAHPVRSSVQQLSGRVTAPPPKQLPPHPPSPAYLSWFCKLGTHGGKRREKAVGHQPGFSPPSSHSRFVQCERDSLFLVPTKPTPPPSSPKKKKKKVCVRMLHVKLLSLLGAIPPRTKRPPRGTGKFVIQGCCCYVIYRLVAYDVHDIIHPCSPNLFS